jgi:hypothetical protein
LPDQFHLIVAPRCRPEAEEGNDVKIDGHFPQVGQRLRRLQCGGFGLAAENLDGENVARLAQPDRFVSVISLMIRLRFLSSPGIT